MQSLTHSGKPAFPQLPARVCSADLGTQADGRGWEDCVADGRWSRQHRQCCPHVRQRGDLALCPCPELCKAHASQPGSRGPRAVWPPAQIQWQAPLSVRLLQPAHPPKRSRHRVWPGPRTRAHPVNLDEPQGHPPVARPPLPSVP